MRRLGDARWDPDTRTKRSQDTPLETSKQQRRRQLLLEPRKWPMPDGNLTKKPCFNRNHPCCVRKRFFFPPRLVVVWCYPSLSGTTATVGLIQTCPWWERSDSTHTGQDCGSCHPASMIALPWDEGATHSKFLLLNRIRLHASRTWFLTTMQITWTMTGFFLRLRK